MTDGVHSCSYYCERPACIKAQRDWLRDENEKLRHDIERAIANHCADLNERRDPA